MFSRIYTRRAGHMVNQCLAIFDLGNILWFPVCTTIQFRWIREKISGHDWIKGERGGGGEGGKCSAGLENREMVKRKNININYVDSAVLWQRHNFALHACMCILEVYIRIASSLVLPRWSYFVSGGYRKRPDGCAHLHPRARCVPKPVKFQPE